jgi:hypothetical protein
MINIHIGLDLSFNSTGITFYNELLDKESNKIISSEIEFHRLVRDKEITTRIINVNQHIYSSKLLSVDLELKHDLDVYENAIEYSNEQIDLTEKYFISVTTIKNIIIKYLNTIKQDYKLDNNGINIFVNMEGSILSGFNFNTQIGVNMLQGFLRAELIKLQMVNNFKTFKFRIIPPTLLKSFFTNNGSADKLEMIESFINNYDGKKLIPQIDLSNKYVSELNDIIDSFALVAFNVYDLKMEEKFLFNIKKIKTKSKKKRKIKPKVNKVNLDKNLPDTNEFENNINSKILKQYEII